MSVAKDFNHRGIPTVRGARWSCQVLKNIVISPRLAGLRTLKGRVVGPAVWEAILTEEESQRLRSLLTDPARRTTRSARRYLLSSLLRCQVCGAKLVSRPIRRRPAYVCSTGTGFAGCGGVSILAEPLESFVTEAVLYRLDSPALSRALARRPDRTREVGDLEIEIAHDQAKLEELAGFWADGKIESGEYFVARKRITDRLAASRARFNRLDRSKSLRTLIDQSAELRQRWSGLNLHQKRAVITTILDHVVVGPATRGGHRFQTERLHPVWRV
jgi:site-specific DNA recombinase